MLRHVIGSNYVRKETDAYEMGNKKQLKTYCVLMNFSTSVG